MCALTEEELRHLEALVRAAVLPERWSVEKRQALANKLITIRLGKGENNAR